MSARPSGAGASALAAVLAICALAACGDSTRVAAPTAPPLAPHAAAAPSSDTSYLPAARVRARILARALGENAARVHLRDALRRSPLATHRLTLETELARPASAALASAIARAAGISADSIRALFTRGPAFDLYLPRTIDRRGWRPDRTLAVAVTDDHRAAPYVVYAPSGDSTAQPDRDAAYLALTPAGDRSRRVAPQRSSTGDAVEDADDGTLSGTLSYVGPRGDTTHVEVAALIPSYRVLPMSASPAERERALAALRQERAAAAPHAGPRRLVACTDSCENGSLIGWSDTTYLVAFYLKSSPEAGSDPDYEPWYDGYFRGARWRLQFNGVPGNTVILVDIPFMGIRPAEHSAATIKVIGGDDNGWWSDDACIASGMTFAGSRYVRDPSKLGVTLIPPDTYTWRHCGGYEDADTWGAQLYWRPRQRPAVTSLRVELDTTYMTAMSLTLPGMQDVPKYQGAYRYAYTGCPSVYYLIGTAADGEALDPTSLSVFATASSANAAVAEPSRPTNGLLRNYAPGTTTLTASLDGVTAQGSYGVMPFISGITLQPAPAIVAPGVTTTERVYWTGSPTGRCLLPYRNLPALRPAWSSSSPALTVALANADSTAVSATPTAIGSYTVTATIGPMRATAAVIAELPPAAAPILRSGYSTSGAAITWSEVTGARGYTVYRRVSGGAWASYASTTAPSFTDASPISSVYANGSPGTPGTEDFRVAAWNYAGTGPQSNVVGFQLSTAGGGTGSGGGGGATFYSRGRRVVRRVHP